MIILKEDRTPFELPRSDALKDLLAISKDGKQSNFFTLGSSSQLLGVSEA